MSQPITPELINAADAYRRAGFLTASGDIPFVGSVHVLGGADADHTLAVVAFSFPNRSLEFVRDGSEYRAAYDVTYDVRAGSSVVLHRGTHSEVRVASFRETLRPEESIIVQQILMLPPGAFTLRVEARNGTVRRGEAEMRLLIPRPSSAALVAAAPVYQAAPRVARAAALNIVVNPRATVVLGRDTALELYLESYGSDAPRHARVLVGANGTVFYRANAALAGDGEVHATVVPLPVAQIGFGLLSATIVPEGDGALPVEVPIAVRLGDELALASFDEMLEYLQFFASADEMRAVRTANGTARVRALRDILVADSSPVAPVRDDVVEYLRRVQVANVEFREDGLAGWLSDRGKVFSAFGPPDDVTDELPPDGARGTRSIVWTYHEPSLRLVFIDRSLRGRWRLTPVSETMFDTTVAHLTTCRSCR